MKEAFKIFQTHLGRVFVATKLGHINTIYLIWLEVFDEKVSLHISPIRIEY